MLFFTNDSGHDNVITLFFDRSVLMKARKQVVVQFNSCYSFYFSEINTNENMFEQIVIVYSGKIVIFFLLMFVVQNNTRDNNLI